MAVNLESITKTHLYIIGGIAALSVLKFFVSYHKAAVASPTPGQDIPTYAGFTPLPANYTAAAHPHTTDVWWSQSQNCDTGYSMVENR